MSTSYLLTEQSESLKTFAEKFSRESNFYNAYEELVVLRYALKEKIHSLDTVNSLLKALTDNAVNSQEVSDPREIISLLKQQAQISTEISASVERTVKTLKTGAEIDILTSNKLDGVQLLYVLERIPVLLEHIIREALTNFAASQDIPIVEEIIDDHVNSITSRMSSTLQECEILTPTSEENTPGLLQEEVLGMLESVPTATNNEMESGADKELGDGPASDNIQSDN